jgi:glutathione peroxidase
MSALEDIRLETANNGTISFDQYAGKPLLIFNSASQCGFTKQYADFQKLHESGRIIPIAIPTNEFGAQEPGNNEEIAQFCTTQYKVTFPVCIKTDLNHEFFKKFGNPQWNFHKYLFNGDHSFVRMFDAYYEPMKILEEI